MARCSRMNDLAVCAIRPDGGRWVANAIVLCRSCRRYADPEGGTGDASAVFTEETKLMALSRAGGRCQCRSKCPGCLTAPDVPEPARQPDM